MKHTRKLAALLLVLALALTMLPMAALAESADDPTVDIVFTKTWADNDSADRPTSLDITLYGDADAVLATATVTGTGDTWTHTFTGVPVYAPSGAQHEYTVEETLPTGYDETAHQDPAVTVTPFAVGNLWGAEHSNNKLSIDIPGNIILLKLTGKHGGGYVLWTADALSAAELGAVIASADLAPDDDVQHISGSSASFGTEITVADGTITFSEKSIWSSLRYNTYTLEKIEVTQHAQSTNTLLPPSTVVPESLTLDLPWSKIVSSLGTQAPGTETFRVELYGRDVLPTCTDDTLTVNGVGSFSGVLKVTAVGSASEIHNLLAEGFYLREVQGTAAGWTYSTESYFVAYNWDDECWLIYDAAEYDTAELGEIPAIKEAISFTNTYNVNLPVYEDDPIVNPPQELPETELPKTGDAGNATLWIALMGGSLLAVAAALLDKKLRRSR